jgi:CheY-like chemotaxis protein
VADEMSNARRSIRALVVDDLHDAAESLARLLQAMGCAATFVTNSNKAMDAAEAMEADIVFLDLGMPGFDGYQLARMLRRRYGERVILVAVTAYGAARDRMRSREAGFDAHVQKPADIPLVESILATVVSARR